MSASAALAPGSSYAPLTGFEQQTEGAVGVQLLHQAA